MSKKDEALKLALEALEVATTPFARDRQEVLRAQAALREALAEQPAQQEPVARQYQNRDGVWKDFISEKHYKDTLEDGSWPIRNLYKSPPAQRTWVGLTDEELEIINDCGDTDSYKFARAIEAKLREKNT